MRMRGRGSATCVAALRCFLLGTAAGTALFASAASPLGSGDWIAPCLQKAWDAPVNVYGTEIITKAWRAEDVLTCLLSFNMNLHDMSVTLENLMFGETSIYAFSPIVRNSLASKQENKCGLGVHDLKVDLTQELQEIYNEYVGTAAEKLGLGNLNASTTASELRDRLLQDTDVPALEFHGRLRDLFARLQDAHTTYTLSSLVLQVLPVEFSLARKDDGSVSVLAAGAPKVFGALNLEEGQQKLLSPVPRELKQIDGRPPLLFLQELADKAGTYHDAGQRLNALLLQENQLHKLTNGHLGDGILRVVGAEQSLLSAGKTKVELTFTDGSSFVDWIIAMNPAIVAGSLSTKDPFYASFQKLEADRDQWRQDRAAECSKIPGCPHDEVVSDASRRFHAVGAYRRLVGDLPDELMKDAARLIANQVAVAPAANPGLHVLDVLLQPRPMLPLSMATAAADHGMRVLRGTDSAAAVTDSTASSVEAPKKSTLKDVKGSVEACINRAGHGKDVKVVYVGGDEEFATVLAVGDMMVYKLQSMGTKVEDMLTALIAYQELVKYARDHNIKRVLIDLVSNGGGLVILSDVLQSLFLKNYDPKELCNLYDKRVDEYWREWVVSFGQGLDHSIQQHVAELEKQAKSTKLDVARWYAKWQLKYLYGLVIASNDILGRAFRCDLMPPGACNGQVIVDAERILSWTRKVEEAQDVESIIAIVREALPKHPFVPTSLYGNAPGSAAKGWFPFTGEEILNIETLEPFQDMTGITEPIEQFWGGVKANFSKRGVFASCPQAVAAPQNILMLALQGLVPSNLGDYKDHPFEDVAVVTDGLAGSAGSAFPSRLIVSGYVTAFTYGGNGDGLMDTSAFAGGNVLEYATWWPRTALAAELGMWLLPESPWEKYALSINATHKHGDYVTPAYPYPMPSQGAAARFNFNIMYMKELGVGPAGAQTMLPRQFYRMPAHKHLMVWPKHIQETCGNPKAQVELYQAIGKENWCEVRMHPEKLGKGWDQACVPDAKKCKCCPATDNPDAKKLSLMLTVTLVLLCACGCTCLGCTSYCCYKHCFKSRVPRGDVRTVPLAQGDQQLTTRTQG